LEVCVEVSAEFRFDVVIRATFLVPLAVSDEAFGVADVARFEVSRADRAAR
jgi:hypothetical protein